MKKLTKMKMENKLEKLLVEVNLLCEVYQNKKEYQIRLSRLSEQISDVYAQLNGLPAINDIERQQWQKTQKVGLKQYFNIESTVQILTTKHNVDPLVGEALKEVLTKINQLSVELEALKDTKEFKEKHKEYLKLKSKLEEVKFKPKPIELPKQPKSKIDGYSIGFIKSALKNLHELYHYDVEAYHDVIRGLEVVSLTQNQIIAINQAMDEGRVDKALSKDFELACQKVFKVLTEKNVYKMKQINFF